MMTDAEKLFIRVKNARDLYNRQQREKFFKGHWISVSDFEDAGLDLEWKGASTMSHDGFQVRLKLGIKLIW